MTARRYATEAPPSAGLLLWQARPAEICQIRAREARPVISRYETACIAQRYAQARKATPAISR